MSTLPPSGRDARTLARAADALTTQVRRIADALTTTTDDAATTPVVSVHGDRDMSPAAREALGALVDVATQQMTEAPAADDQTLRWARRESLLVLLIRLQRGRTLTEAEARALRQHVETEMHEGEQAREQLAKAQRAADLLAGAHRRAEEYEQERDQAIAVLAEVLRRFTPALVNGKYAFYQAEQPVPIEEFDRWRVVLAHDVERPWWQQVDEARAEVAAAQAAIKRARQTLQEVLATFAVGAAYGERPTYTVPGSVDKETFERWCAALDGTEQQPDENARLIAEYQAAILRVLAVGEDPLNGHTPSGPEQEAYVRGWRFAIHEVRRAVEEGPADPEALHAKVEEATATLRRVRSVLATLKDQGATGQGYHQAVTNALAGPRPDDD